MEARAGGGLGYHRMGNRGMARTLNMASKATEEEILISDWVAQRRNYSFALLYFFF